MRIFDFLFIIFLFIFGVGTVNATHYPSSRIERYATNTPRIVENNLKSLTRHLVKPLDDDYDKAKMIAFWIASHINYDEYLYNGEGTTKLMKKHHIQSPRDLLNSRVGICSEFADLFDEMCRIAGIKAGKISGFAYPSVYKLHRKEKKLYSHAWNYFLYNNKKIYVDTTFMANGRTTPEHRVTNLSHKRALRNVKNDNRNRSQVNNFEKYYFDFNYKDEIKKMRYKHEER